MKAKDSVSNFLCGEKKHYFSIGHDTCITLPWSRTVTMAVLRNLKLVFPFRMIDPLLVRINLLNFIFLIFQFLQGCCFSNSLICWPISESVKALTKLSIGLVLLINVL